MTVNQVYALLNEVAAQYQGSDILAPIDATNFVSYGKTITSAEDVDRFVGILVDRIGRTIIRTLDLDIEFPNMITDSMEFGAILQKITVEPLDAQSAEAWNVGDADFRPNQFKIDKPVIRQSLFSGINTWEFDLTIPDQLFKQAFTNETQFASFVDAITSALMDSMTIYINYANRLVLNTAIANKLNDNKNVVHLITEFGDASVTAANALRSPEFLRFMGKRMGDMIRYMKEPTRRFNNEGVLRATTRDNMHIFLLGEVGAAYSTYLESDTFHRELLALPLYNEVTDWQSAYATVEGDDPTPADMPDFTTASTLNLTIEDGVTVNKSGIVAAFFDRQAIGSTIYNRRMSTDRNNRNEYTNYTNKADIGYYYDSSENGVVFVLD